MNEGSLPGLVRHDPWLEPYAADICDRHRRYQEALQTAGDLISYSLVYQERGLHFDEQNSQWIYREWAPRAHALSLVGDFNGWSREAHPLTREGEFWVLRLPADTLQHGDLYKVHVVGQNGAHDRLPPYAQRCLQDEQTKDFTAQVWHPDHPHRWRHPHPQAPSKPPRIYEVHLGMATEAERVGTYAEFTENVLPRIAALGYNVIQLMAIAEHPYYGSFGYHVSNFFAPSSRFGTPEELKQLIDTAHGLGLTVLMDLVHSHAVKNFAEGLAAFDGAEGLYFEEKEHPQWDSRLFRYGDPMVRQFLLANLTYWMQEFRFDGFRFDGVTSMLYHHHGERAFDHYDQYFREGVNWDALTYLQLATTLIHKLNSQALIIAEDMSGMPGLCRPLTEGGFGFDYRLAMGIPDYWIRLLKHVPDEQWDIEEIFQTLTNRRHGEGTIAYAESHDQALVGDKSIAFWLMDQEMYTDMNQDSQNPIIDRGIALHKIIRLLTLSLGGDGYLNFVGNEFGHPEWVDFPREGNGWSYQFCRRQWSLVDHPDLRYQHLHRFDEKMLSIAEDLLLSDDIEVLNFDQVNQCLQYRRGSLIFAINLHPTRSIEGYQFSLGSLDAHGSLRTLVSSDDPSCGGHGNAISGTTFPIVDRQVRVYLPCRTALVLSEGALEPS